MLVISGQQRFCKFGRRGGKDGVSRTQAMREAIFLQVHHGPMPDIFGERQCLELKFHKEGLDRSDLLFVVGALNQFEKGLGGNEFSRLMVNRFRSLFVSTRGPDEHICVKDQDNVPHADGSSFVPLFLWKHSF